MSKKILLIFLGLLLSIVIFEIGLRLGGVILLSVQRRHNMQALKQKGAYRVLCLGESTTQGQYPGFLNEILNQSDIGMKFSVIDRGLVGTNSLLIVNRLERDIDEYKPQMAVVMMGINDKEDSILPYAILPKSRFRIFFQSLRTYKLVKLLWLRMRHPFKKIPDLGLDEESSYIELAGAYRRTGRIVDAKHLHNALGFKLDSYEDYIELGEAYAKIGRISEAEGALKKAIALRPDNGRAYAALGGAYAKIGRISEAEEVLKKAIALNPDNEYAYIELAEVAAVAGRITEAEKIFKKAIALNPNNYDAYLELGKFYNRLSRSSQAEEVLKKAFSLKPDDYDAYDELGEAYAKMDRIPEAIEALKKTFSHNPEQESQRRLLMTIAMIYELNSNRELAAEYYRESNKLGLEMYKPATKDNFLRLKEILGRRGIAFVCVQYPMSEVEPLKQIFRGNDKGIVFVDNEGLFKEAVKKEGYWTYFRDTFGGKFGHCTDKGNRFLAENIAEAILRDVFNK